VLVIADTSIHVAVQLTKITHLHFTLNHSRVLFSGKGVKDCGQRDYIEMCMLMVRSSDGR